MDIMVGVFFAGPGKQISRFIYFTPVTLEGLKHI